MSQFATIAMLKDVPQKWEADRNWDVFESQFEIHATDADVFVTPEGYLDGYATTEEDWTAERFATVAERVEDSERVDRLCVLAKESGTAIVFGLTQILDGRFYNARLGSVERECSWVSTTRRTCRITTIAMRRARIFPFTIFISAESGSPSARIAVGPSRCGPFGSRGQRFASCRPMACGTTRTRPG